MISYLLSVRQAGNTNILKVSAPTQSWHIWSMEGLGGSSRDASETSFPPNYLTLRISHWTNTTDPISSSLFLFLSGAPISNIIFLGPLWWDKPTTSNLVLPHVAFRALHLMDLLECNRPKNCLDESPQSSWAKYSHSPWSK